ncbi:MarR family protein [Halorientalis persicus]|jgi:DNA-binding transcriptional ArsR family regulator|uniref:MarR family protein n=1 Tax=Halorientalis persicus TaxID=1367881 RepID=A0A1H8LI17_9EURY|nr:MarR family transcriptional regulator [Halorientalis persicus]SEO04801.1 MarR family protein [Halorientalis persicus]
MDLRALHTRHLFAAVVFLASTLVLALQLINPSPVMVRVGENGTNVAELGGYFRYPDVAVVAASACSLGASGTYLLLADRPDAGDDDLTPTADRDAPAEPVAADGRADPGPSDELLEARRQEWEETAERLANNEREIYETLLAADGVLPQSDIVDRTALSKATVSRELDSLETKNLVERKRRGMGNVVLLQ